MEDQPPRPADRYRYPTEESVNTIRLYAVLEDESRNYRGRWRYRMQVLGSILVWAHRGNATRIVYDPDLDPPFVYTDADNNSATSEFPQPPPELRPELTRSLFLDTIDGHPIFRPLRRLTRRLDCRFPRAILKAPDRERAVESSWRMTIGSRTTTFDLLDTSPYP